MEDNDIIDVHMEQIGGGKAIDHCSARVQTDPLQLRSLFEGTRLQADHIPEMEDNDIIDVHMEQIGGAGDVSPVFKPEDTDAELIHEKFRLRTHPKACIQAKTDFKEQVAKLKSNLSELQGQNDNLTKENGQLRIQSHHHQAE